MTLYRHTQIGWVMLVTGLVMLPILLPLMRSDTYLAWLPPVLFALTILMFGWLTIVVEEQYLIARFGVGLFRKRIRFDAVRSYSLVRNPWYFGWGIRRIPGGWLYNVSGLSAVEFRLLGGGVVRIGTDEPDRLQQSLAQVVHPSTMVETEAPARSWSRWSVSAIALVAILLLIFLRVQSRPPAVTVENGRLQIRSGFYSDDIPLSQISEVSLQDQIPRVLVRTNGYASGRTLRGHFKLDVIGTADLYIQQGTPPYVVVQTPGRVVIFNFAEPAQTRERYSALVSAGARALQ